MSQSAAHNDAFTPSGVITLTTDFGHKDPFVGVMKGQVLRRFPAAQLVDLTHEVLVHWPAEAGFWLGRSFRYFPTGTVHVAVVDPGVGSARDIAVIEAEGQVFLAPDNGLLAGVIERLRAPPVLRRLDESVLAGLGVHQPSATFHGRDIFAPLAAELAVGRLQPRALGPIVGELVPGWLEEPVVTPTQVTGAVVTVDHFGNLLTNIDAALLPQVPQAVVRAGGHEIPLRRTYSDVRPGDYLALVNSFGVLEVARAEQSAAQGLGLDRGAPVIVGARRGT
ncbi:MAG TPA: SAM-dependent chlorinase/fluorinase [Steroidobacteraceae bacterium]|nr:SAM-dependent chlorinase/fluorinase [Steroidobacteraceae bacterium]